MSNKFLNMKICVNSEGHFKQIQEVLFKLGYKWFSECIKPIHLDKIFLYVYDDGDIAYDISEDYFNEKEFEEVTLEDLQSLLSVIGEKGIVKDISTITSVCNNDYESSLLQEVLNSLEVSMYLLDENNVNYSPNSFEMYLKGVINTVRIMNKYQGGE